MTTALAQLVERPFPDAKLVFITTAASAQDGNHDWLIEDLNRVYELGWGQFNVLEINGLPRQIVLRRLTDADVIYVEGGNVYHLARSIIEAGLVAELLRMLEYKVYVGVSAGSMLFARRLTDRLTALFGTDDELYQLNGRTALSPFDLFDWFVQPHVDFTSWDPMSAARLGCPLYAIDDQTALRVVGRHVEVVSEGLWTLVDGFGASDEPPDGSS
jgi:dipeptidase E